MIYGKLDQDCREKRAQFIDNSVKIREAFSFAHPWDKIVAVDKYCSSFFGSQLWTLDSQAAESVYSAWRLNIKLSWDVPRGCHTFFVDNVLAPHMWSLKSSLLFRFHVFFLGLLSSDSKEVQLVSSLSAREIRTGMGHNLRLIHEITGLDPWDTSAPEMKSALRTSLFSPVPEGYEWRVRYLQKLLTQKLEAFYNGNDENMDILLH